MPALPCSTPALPHARLRASLPMKYPHIVLGGQADADLRRGRRSRARAYCTSRSTSRRSWTQSRPSPAGAACTPRCSPACPRCRQCGRRPPARARRARAAASLAGLPWLACQRGQHGLLAAQARTARRRALTQRTRYAQSGLQTARSLRLQQDHRGRAHAACRTHATCWRSSACEARQGAGEPARRRRSRGLARPCCAAAHRL